MSNIALSWAFKCHVGNASAKAVLVYLADRADDDGTAAYPKIATIVNVTELSERTVRTALKTLQERGFIRRGDQRYARLGKGGRNRLPQYCQIVWDLAVESDPSTLEWIKETHTAEQDPMTMGNTVDPAASTVTENGESKDVTPENVGTKPISSTANLAGLENDSETALQISHLQHCESCTPSTANAAVLPYKDKTLQVNPPSKPSSPLPLRGISPASGATAAEKTETEQLDEDDTEIAEAAGRVLASLGEQRSMLGLATPSPTKADRKAVIGLYRRLVDQGAQWPTLVMVDAIGFAMNGDWWPKRIRTGRALARRWDELNDDMILAAGRTDGDAHAQAVPAAAPEPDAAPWLPDWAVETLAELDGQDATAGGEATDMTTRIDCSEAGFSEFLLANPQLGGHEDLVWQLDAVYWRNKRLGHPKAVGLLIQYARAWAARNPGETAIGRLQAHKTPMTQGRRP